MQCIAAMTMGGVAVICNSQVNCKTDRPDSRLLKMHPEVISFSALFHAQVLFRFIVTIINIDMTVSKHNNLSTLCSSLHDSNLVMRLVMECESDPGVPDLFQGHVHQSLLG